MVHFCSSSMRQAFWARQWFYQLPMVLLGAMGACCFGTNARAADMITLKYNAQEETFEVSNIATFVRTGQAERPELQSFLQKAPEAKRLLQELFGAEIYISPTFINKVEDKIQSPTGEFVLIQINKLISSSSASDDLDLLRTAIRDALADDNRLSLLEIAQNYPTPNIQIDLTGLEPVYNDVKGFVERVLPALEVARDYLQNLICDCPSQSAQTSSSSQANPQTVPVAQRTSASGCIQGTTAAQPTVEQPASSGATGAAMAAQTNPPAEAKP